MRRAVYDREARLLKHANKLLQNEVERQYMIMSIYENLTSHLDEDDIDLKDFILSSIGETITLGVVSRYSLLLLSDKISRVYYLNARHEEYKKVFGPVTQAVDVENVLPKPKC